MTSNTVIEHIVLYSFKDENDLDAAVSLIKSFETKALKDGAPYLLSVKCGTTHPNPPVRSAGFNLASVVRFASDEDRLYFVKQDPVHQELVKFATEKLEKGVLVIDFVDGNSTPVATSQC